MEQVQSTCDVQQMTLNMENMSRLVHLDLKRSPIKVEFITKKAFRLFRSWGVTGVLIEWEDTFPYSGSLDDIGSRNEHYSVNEVNKILKAAEENELDVIPLVQTFGHLEFLLKRPKFEHLREEERFDSSICPSNSESVSVLTKMIEQIMKMHSKTKFIHIGGDEVWHMGVCGHCSKTSKERLYINHVSSIIRFVRVHYPNVIPIIWDDMMRNIELDILKDSNIGNSVELMIWNYSTSENFSISNELLDRYSAIFPNIWIATAFKGATGSCQLMPLIGHHISNHEKWIQVVKENASKFKTIRGLTLTGWSRYDHYATLCELLPVGFPSLAICLKVWMSGKFSDEIYNEVSSQLGFSAEFPLKLFPSNKTLKSEPKRNFPGSQIYTSIEKFIEIRKASLEFVNGDYKFVPHSWTNIAKSHNVVDGKGGVKITDTNISCIPKVPLLIDLCFVECIMTWMNPWNVKKNNCSTMQLENIYKHLTALMKDLDWIGAHLSAAMQEVYYDYTIEEWKNCYVEPCQNKVLELILIAQSQLRNNLV